MAYPTSDDRSVADGLTTARAASGSPTNIYDAAPDPLLWAMHLGPKDRTALVTAWVQADLVIRSAFAGGPVKDVCWRVVSTPGFAWLPGELRDEALRAYMEADRHASSCASIIEAVRGAGSLKLETATATVKRNLAAFIETYGAGNASFVTFTFALLVSSLPSWPMLHARNEPIEPPLGAFAGECLDYDLRIRSYLGRVADVLAERLPSPLGVRFAGLLAPTIAFIIDQAKFVLDRALSSHHTSAPGWSAASHSALNEYRVGLAAVAERALNPLWAGSIESGGPFVTIPTRSAEQ